MMRGPYRKRVRIRERVMGYRNPGTFGHMAYSAMPNHCPHCLRGLTAHDFSTDTLGRVDYTCRACGRDTRQAGNWRD